MESLNNISNDKVFSEAEWKWFEKQAVIIPVTLSNLISYVNTLTSRYFFPSPILYFDTSCDKFRHFLFRNEVLLSQNMVLFVSLHNRIVIMPEETYRMLHPHHHIEWTNPSLDNYLPQLDRLAIHAPVVWKFDPRNTKQFFTISAHAILLHIHNDVYDIPRKIFEMLYAESEDFMPTTTEDLIIKTQARHQLFWQGYFLTDLLKTDVAMVIDTQNRLRKEEQEILNTSEPDMQNKKTIIAIHGIKGSGKDTLSTFIKMHIYAYINEFHKNSQALTNLFNQALNNIDNNEWLCDEINLKLERFAKPLKAIIASFLGISENDLNSQGVKKMELNPETWYDIMGTKLTIRDLHTLIADGIKAKINEDVFVNSCIDRISADNINSIFIVNDVRFQNELEAMQVRGAYCVKIQRQLADMERDLKSYIHPSEAGIESEKFDYLISNDGTYADLAIKTADMLLDIGMVSNEYVKLLKRVIND